MLCCYIFISKRRKNEGRGKEEKYKIHVYTEGGEEGRRGDGEEGRREGGEEGRRGGGRRGGVEEGRWGGE